MRDVRRVLAARWAADVCQRRPEPAALKAGGARGSARALQPHGLGPGRGSTPRGSGRSAPGQASGDRLHRPRADRAALAALAAAPGALRTTLPRAAGRVFDGRPCTAPQPPSQGVPAASRWTCVRRTTLHWRPCPVPMAACDWPTCPVQAWPRKCLSCKSKAHCVAQHPEGSLVGAGKRGRMVRLAAPSPCLHGCLRQQPLPACHGRANTPPATYVDQGGATPRPHGTLVPARLFS